MVKDPDGSRILWNNLQRSPSLTYAIAYLKERYKEYQKHQAEKKREITIRAKPLRTMVNLRLLQINYINLEGQFQFPSELKWLEWKGCRLKSFSSDFGAKKLAILDLSHSKVERLWSWHSNEASLRKIRNLSMPGSKIPDWLCQDVVTFTERRNSPLRGVTIGVVVSLNDQIQDDSRRNLPGIVDIQAQILKQGLPIFTTVFNLNGVPNKGEDQLHLCRYPPDHPLVSQLKNGYQILVTKRTPPFMKGVELKKWGVYLVYEGEDDYEGDEESLDEGQQSISEKLAKFFSTFEEDVNVNSEYSCDQVETSVQETRGRAQMLCWACGLN
ncbi:hypothetical protein L484_011004 [Morus notabilis]|uniref:Uncharacterized protein n=1 Tax=Morus notabilis TaxID=981085 RepID=W9R6V5_9ROSA|nr:hypothetical protein L484_011004 [Morus notabilis]